MNWRKGLLMLPFKWSLWYEKVDYRIWYNWILNDVLWIEVYFVFVSVFSSLPLFVGSSGGNVEHAVVFWERWRYRWLVSLRFQCFWLRWTAHLCPTSPTYVSEIEISFNHFTDRSLLHDWLQVYTKVSDMPLRCMNFIRTEYYSLITEGSRWAQVWNQVGKLAMKVCVNWLNICCWNVAKLRPHTHTQT